MKDLISLDIIEKKIFLIRGHRVMLDSDLAELYEVTTGNFNKAVSSVVSHKYLYLYAVPL